MLRLKKILSIASTEHLILRSSDSSRRLVRGLDKCRDRQEMLLYAVQMRERIIVKTLISLGVSITYYDDRALSTACIVRDEAIIELLLINGADLSVLSSFVNYFVVRGNLILLKRVEELMGIKEMEIHGLTTLAIKYDRRDVVKWFLPRLNSNHSFSKTSLVANSVTHCRLEIFALFLDELKGIETRLYDILYRCIELGRIEFVRLLLTTYRFSKQRLTLTMMSTKPKDPVLIQLLVDSGANQYITTMSAVAGGINAIINPTINY